MLAKTPVIQCSSCYSAVSALLFLHCSQSLYQIVLIIRHFCHTHYLTPDHQYRYFISLSGPDPLPSRSLYQAAPPETILQCCSALLQNLVGNSGETQCLGEAEQQAGASVDVPYPPLQIVNSVPFCLFSLYLYPLSAPFLNPLSSPSHHPFFLLFDLLR